MIKQNVISGLLVCSLSYLLLGLLPANSAFASSAALAGHPSPYLRKHQDDAVQWLPFSPEAFEQAKQKKRPILLSSGYLSCYWCYRMGEDTFKNKKVGALINETFVPIMVDRELEPEVDAYLQYFMEQQRGFGGWPLTVVLTPDAKPIAGFSYTPADEFGKIMTSFADNWQSKQADISASAARKAQSMQAWQRVQRENDATEAYAPTLITALVEQANQAADTEYGGFGQAEKFPFVAQLAALFALNEAHPSPELKTFLQTSLSAMVGSGLRDHVGGGFFRYTSDREWSRPHYEKMLYTQALLVPLLRNAGTAWKQPIYSRAADETLQAMLTQFQRDDGLFRSGVAAIGTDGEAGSYYLWTEKQLKAVLEDDAGRVHNLLGDSDTILPFVLAEQTERDALHRKLLAVRKDRQQSVDDKALLGQNGLALAALAAGVDNAAYKAAGEKLLAHLSPLLAKDTKTALPKLVDRPEAGAASLRDQVYWLVGLNAWAQATDDAALLKQVATQLLRIQTTHFRDGVWIQAEDKPLVGDAGSVALVDSQLPSPSGLWLQLAQQHSADNEDLAKALADVKKVLPNSLQDNAFFHATTIITLTPQPPLPQGEGE